MKRRRNSYASLSEAASAAQKLGFRTGKDYYRGCKVDPLLPSGPDSYYKSEWVSWHDFLGKLAPGKKYATLAEASEAVKRFEFSGQDKYLAGYKVDPMLPACPSLYYSDEWVDWYSYLGKTPPRVYDTLDEASKAAQVLGFKNRNGYRAGYKRDEMLPADPSSLFKRGWVSWHSFLGIDPRVEKYRTLSEAKHAVRKLRISSGAEYQSECTQDPRLPLCPWLFYKKEWISLHGFLLPINYFSLEDVKVAVRVLKIKDSVAYRSIYKLYPPLPAHPERVFSSNWIDWYDLCGIPRHYEYFEASAIATAERIKSQAQYRKYITDSGDLRMPKKPDVVYGDVWRNWYVFLGKEEPFITDFICEPYLSWKKSILEFMRGARGGKTKESILCRFLRLFVQKYKLGLSPEEFLVVSKIDINNFKKLLTDCFSEARRKTALVSINEYLDYIIREKLTLEDEFSGELVVVEGVRNPLSNLLVNCEFTGGSLGETCKPALAFQYVSAVKKWIVPDEAKSFNDLVAVHQFDADWIDVDEGIIDVNDPDCVIRREGCRTKMWCPIYWMHTYALVSIPARGRQIAYNDSGEGDKNIPEIEDGNLVWRENCSLLSGSTNSQGFIKHYPGDQFGMHFTTNKTSNQGCGYDVAWIPNDLAYWLIRLRRWQQKYNPINQPLLWLSCTRTELNEIQRKAKGANCFLFRDFGEQEAGHYTGRLTQRLAAALYYSQPKGIVLAELNGKSNTLSHYSSKYTPHSMRVSLITAYVEEFGLPIEVVMKIAGHSSIIMSIYYLKVSSEGLRRKFSEGEKRALKNKAYFAQEMIEQGRIDEIKCELVSNSDQALNSISNVTAVGSYLFRDYGLCPFAGSRCSDGGELLGHSKIRAPVPAGYLGSQNCIRCRHFVSGPVFIGGLLSLGNEISLQANTQFHFYDKLEKKSFDIRGMIGSLDEVEYTVLKVGGRFDDAERNKLEAQLRKVQSESEGAAKKLDVFMCDIQAVARLIKQSQALINQRIETLDKNNSPQLIVQLDHELHLSMEESSYFQQVCEVCENADIYESACADIALTPRSQMIDKMISINNLRPGMFSLDKEQQLVVGNQISQMLLNRLKSWERVNDLIEGRILLQDLSDCERIAPRDFEVLFGKSLKRLEAGND